MVKGNIHEGLVTLHYMYFFFFGSIMQSKRYAWVSSDAWISNVSLFSYFLMDYLKHWQKSLCINPSSLLLNNYTHHHVPGALLIFDDIRTRTQNSFSCFLFFFFSSPRTPSKLYSWSHKAAHNTSPADSPPRSRNKIPPPAAWRSDKAGLAIKYSLQTSTHGQR